MQWWKILPVILPVLTGNPESLQPEVDNTKDPLDFEDIYPNLLQINRANEWMTNIPGYIFGLSRGAGDGVSSIGVGFHDRPRNKFLSLVSDVNRAEWIQHNGVSRGIEEIDGVGQIQWTADTIDKSVYVKISQVSESIVPFIFIEEMTVTPSGEAAFTVTDSQREDWRIEFSQPFIPSRFYKCTQGDSSRWLSPSVIADRMREDRTECPWQMFAIINFESQNELVFRLSRAGETVGPLSFPAMEHSDWPTRAFSNVFGNLGRFFGKLTVSDPLGLVTLTPIASRLSMTGVGPSRSKFPRPFLWDDGFHLLAIDNYNRPIAVEIVTSWLRSQLV